MLTDHFIYRSLKRDSTELEDQKFVSETIHKMTRKKGDCSMESNKKSAVCNIRNGFTKFIRTAQHQLFNPNRPTSTCIYFDLF